MFSTCRSLPAKHQNYGRLHLGYSSRPGWPGFCQQTFWQNCGTSFGLRLPEPSSPGFCCHFTGVGLESCPVHPRQAARQGFQASSSASATSKPTHAHTPETGRVGPPFVLILARPFHETLGSPLFRDCGKERLFCGFVARASLGG